MCEIPDSLVVDHVAHDDYMLTIYSILLFGFGVSFDVSSAPASSHSDAPRMFSYWWPHEATENLGVAHQNQKP